MKKHYKIRVKGIVQGVGFRPFVYRIAIREEITGSVLNDTEGVLIQAEGNESSIGRFLYSLENEHPSLARISSIDINESDPVQHTDFSIEKSVISSQRNAFYPPDTAVCADCLAELKEGSDPRYKYPFITCINCGPRFSIIEDIPYDRPNTTMKDFEMCHRCLTEYNNPEDRRHHTQPQACPVCGPRMALYTMNGELITGNIDEIITETLNRLKNGQIGALKSMGGFHLAADATNETAVQLLRERKKRPFKPFAIMCGSVTSVRKICELSPVEEKLITGIERPILLLKRKKELIENGQLHNAGGQSLPFVAPSVAPGVSVLGVMLPCTPFQYMLFENNEALTLIMTSGNIAEEPIVYDDRTAFGKLSRIADFIVTYNRDIRCQTDDSVLFVENEKPVMVRRSRGYVPIPFISKQVKIPIFAAGGDLKNSFAFAKENYIIMSQHMGDMEDPDTFTEYRKAFDHLKKIFDIEPGVIVSDLHPGYHTTGYAETLAAETGVRLMKVQHHHAHTAAVMEELGLEKPLIGISFDGTGYGTDGTLWGSEFLIADKKSFTRKACFSYFALPGGESAIRDVWKTGVSLLIKACEAGPDIPLKIFQDQGNVDFVIEMIRKKINSPLTCSIGRLFDGISAILGICRNATTEAEAAILLEEAAGRGIRILCPGNLSIEKQGDILTASSEDAVERCLNLMRDNHPVEDIALSFHHWITDTAVSLARTIRDETGINETALSGGVFHNRILLRLISASLEKEGFAVYLPEKVPVNDGSIALGQIAIAANSF